MRSFLPYSNPKLSIATMTVILFALAVFYPGAMSIDSISILGQARAFVFNDRQPPLFGFIWHFLDLIGPGPLGMLIVLVLTFYTALALIIAQHTDRDSWHRCGAFVMLALFPPLFGIIGVMWIDILMASALLSSIACAQLARHQVTGQRRYLFVALSLFALLVGALSRHNALLAALALIPLALSPLWRTLDSLKAKAILLVSSCLVGVLFAVSFQLVMKILCSEHTHLWQAVAVYDLAGISVRNGQNLFPQEVYPEATLDNMRVLYSSRSYTPLFLGEQIHSDTNPHPKAPPLHYTGDSAQLSQLKRSWLAAVRRFPVAYLRHRAHFFADLINLTSAPLWTPVYDGIAQNNLGYPPTPHDVNGRFLRAYLEIAMHTLLFRPFIWLVAIVAIIPIVLVYRFVSKWLILSLAGSALLHACSLFVGAVSGDFRYSHWIIVCALLALTLIYFEAMAKHRCNDLRTSRRLLDPEAHVPADIPDGY
jgi:hypothetical protein